MKVSIILPVYNEEKILKNSIAKITEFLNSIGVDYELIICDDDSNDGTSHVAKEILLNHDNVEFLHFDHRIGKGGTIKNAMKIVEGDIAIFMDSDLSTNLKHLPQLIEEVKKNGGIAIGIRNLTMATRGSLTRTFLSIAFNVIVRAALRTGITDHQCGFKGFDAKVAKRIIPKIRASGFLFDAEIIANARMSKTPITAIPVEWKDDRIKYTSKVIPLRAALSMLADLIILRLSRIGRQITIPYREIYSGHFTATNKMRSKTYPTTHIWIDVGNKRVLSALRKIYLVVAFG